MSEECVYVLGTPGSNVVKIGRTTNLKKRLADIQRMSPVPLEVLWTHPGGFELESALHRRFANIRSHGEWFRFDRSPVTSIREAVEALAPERKREDDSPWPLTRIAEILPTQAGEATLRIRAHLASHAHGEWCSLCDLWPHKPVARRNGWCARCDLHKADHDDTSFTFPVAFLAAALKEIA